MQSISTDRQMKDSETKSRIGISKSDIRKVNKDRCICFDLEDAIVVARGAPGSRHLTAFLKPDGLFDVM